MATGRVDYNSVLIRNRWVEDGLVQAASESFFSPYTGHSADSIVHQENNAMAKAGHTIVFSSTGSFSGQAVADRERVYGTGEDKTIFSNMLTVRRYRVEVFNGDEFDGKEIGNLAITQHMNSRMLLSDLFIRVKDQSVFDAAQGCNGQAPSHIINIGTKFDYNDLLDIEHILRTSRGYHMGDIRRPMKPYKMMDGQKCWFLVLDAAMSISLRKSEDYKKIMYTGDVRGNTNRVIKGVFGKIGSLMIVEAPNFFGTSTVAAPFGINSSRIEIAGMRQRSASNTNGDKAYWTGEAEFDYDAPNVYSRGFVLGAGAFQMGFGKQPNYRQQFSEDYSITSGSMLEWWYHVQKAKLKQESGPDLDMAKVTNMDVGVIAVDFQVKGTRGAINEDGSNRSDTNSDGSAKGTSDGASGQSRARRSVGGGASGESDDGSGFVPQGRAAEQAREAEDAKQERIAKGLATRAKNKAIKSEAAQVASDAAESAEGGDGGVDGGGASGGSNDNEGVG